jgi:hypothetical protein
MRLPQVSSKSANFVGLVLRESDGSIDTMAVEHCAGRIVAIYLIRNPNKLQHVWF